MVTKAELELASKIDRLNDKVTEISIQVQSHTQIDSDRYETQQKVLEKIGDKLEIQSAHLSEYNISLKEHMSQTMAVREDLKFTKRVAWLSAVGVGVIFVSQFVPASLLRPLLSFILSIFVG
jgi:hypothetical protein